MALVFVYQDMILKVKATLTTLWITHIPNVFYNYWIFESLYNLTYLASGMQDVCETYNVNFQVKFLRHPDLLILRHIYRMFQNDTEWYNSAEV